MNELTDSTTHQADSELTNSDTVAAIPEQDREEANAPDSEAKELVIEVANPTTEEMQTLRAGITADYDFAVDTKAVKFNFKKTVDKDSGIEIIRKPVDLAIPYPSVDGIIAIIENKDEEGNVRENNKGLELLQEAIETVVNAAARSILYDDRELTAATFPVEKLSWEFIANIPKVTRRGGGIPKETWDEFAADYIEVMPEATGKDIPACTNAAKLFSNKLSTVRTNKPVLELLMGQLAVYAEHSPNIEDYVDCVNFLVKKGEDFLNTTEEELLANL